MFGAAIQPHSNGHQGEFEGGVGIPLPLGSALRIDGHAADTLYHAVPASRSRRISLTFRRLKPHAAAYLNASATPPPGVLAHGLKHCQDAATNASPGQGQVLGHPKASSKGKSKSKGQTKAKQKPPMLCNHPRAVSSCKACQASPGGNPPWPATATTTITAATTATATATATATPAVLNVAAKPMPKPCQTSTLHGADPID